MTICRVPGSVFSVARAFVIAIAERPCVASSPVVSDITTSQRTDGLKLVDIYYNLADDKGVFDDFDDLATLSDCLTQADVFAMPPGCDPVAFAGGNLDGDGDVDLHDFGSLQSLYRESE